MDTASLEDIQGRLEPLTDAKRPFSAFAREAQAMSLLQHGQAPQAREILVVLKNELGTPQVVSQRADVVIAAIDGGAAANIRAILARPVAAPAAQ